MSDVSRGYVRGKFQIEPEAQPAVMMAAAGNHAIEAHPDTLTAREVALSRGYTGNTCSECGSANMKISGHCEVCENCGTTTGCS